MKPAYAIALLTVVGCSNPNPQVAADAALTSDAPSVDAPRADAPMVADAAADAPVDGSVACPPGQVCLQLAPVDGVTNLPAGRLAIAWIADGSSLQFEVAYDQPWVAAPITKIDVSQIAAPSAGMQMTGLPSCTSLFAPAVAVLSTDPDMSGSISSDEILNGETDHSIYGIHQQVIAWFANPCPPDPPDFPDGFAQGIHVYTVETPVHQLDGTATTLQTCQPGSAACSNLDNPF